MAARRGRGPRRAGRDARRAVVAVDTGSQDASADLLDAAYGRRGRARPSAHVVPGGGAARARAARPRHGADARVGLAAPRRLASRARRARRAARGGRTARPTSTCSDPSCGSGPRCGGCSSSASPSRAPAAARPAWSAVSTTRASTTSSARCWPSTPPGMLVRRGVLDELGGFDDAAAGVRQRPRLRVAGRRRPGTRTLVVPEAVVFHAEAAHRGLRRTPLTGRHTHYQERRAALYTLLVNSPRARAAVAGGAADARHARADDRLPAGPLAGRGARRPRCAGRRCCPEPGRPAARRERRRRGAAAAAPGRGPCACCAPAWLPYRHGLDFVGDVAAGADQPGRRRRRAPSGRPLPSATRRPRRPRLAPSAARDEDDELADTGVVAPLPHQPRRARPHRRGRRAGPGRRPHRASAHVCGGALSPVPAGAGDWWRLHYESWHPLGFGTDVPAPPYVARARAARHACSAPTGAVSAAAAGGGALRAVGRVALPARRAVAWSARAVRRAGCSSPAPRRTRWCR